MKAIGTFLGVGTATVFLIGCAALVPQTSGSVTVFEPPPPRTLVLDGFSATEGDFINQLTSWKCSDRVRGGRTLVEVGYFYSPTGMQIGFVLYDGGDVGVEASYQRRGLDHRWDWGWRANQGYDFAFVIKPNRDGFYYDVTRAKGGTATASNDYSCRPHQSHPAYR